MAGITDNIWLQSRNLRYAFVVTKVFHTCQRYQELVDCRAVRLSTLCSYLTDGSEERHVKQTCKLMRKPEQQ